MDNYLKLFVVFFLWCDVSAGRTYRTHYGRPYDSHSQFHHGFEHYDRRSWHNGAPEWDSPLHHRIRINNAQNRHPIIHRNDYQESKEYWRQHHPVSNKYDSRMDMAYPGAIDTILSHQVQQLSPVTPSRSVTFLQCMQLCPSPIEYNPVCGTNNVTYVNPTRLNCAKQCGLQVELQLNSRCPSTYTLQVDRTLPKSTPPIQTELPENKEEYWTDIPLKEPPAFFYTDPSETTETYISDVSSNEPTRTRPLTESAISKPGHLQIHGTTANRDSTRYPQGNVDLPESTSGATDEDENFDIDTRFQSFDNM